MWLKAFAFLWLLVVVIPEGLRAEWREEIPFKMMQGFGMVVQGGVGPVDKLNLLFDSGAVPSVISKKLAKRIGIQGSTGMLSLEDKQVSVPYVTLNDVRFGAMHADSLAAAIVDLDWLEKQLGARIDGIIGVDIFAGKNFSIDYRHRKILPGLASRPLQQTHADIFDFQGSHYWVLSVQLAGERFRMLLDTGANDVVLFGSGLPDSFLNARGKTGAFLQLNAEGRKQLLQPQRVAIEAVQFKDQPIVVLDKSPLAANHFDGLIGPSALGVKWLEFDWEHKCVRWERE